MFVGVFGMCSECICAPVMASALEIQEIIEIFKLSDTSFELHLCMVPAKAKEGQNDKVPVFNFWTAAVGSGAPPIESNVCVGVFAMHSELILEPVTRCMVEIRKIIEKSIGTLLIL